MAAGGFLRLWSQSPDWWWVRGVAWPLTRCIMVLVFSVAMLSFQKLTAEKHAVVDDAVSTALMDEFE